MRAVLLKLRARASRWWMETAGVRAWAGKETPVIDLIEKHCRRNAAIRGFALSDEDVAFIVTETWCAVQEELERQDRARLRELRQRRKARA